MLNTLRGLHLRERLGAGVPAWLFHLDGIQSPRDGCATDGGAGLSAPVLTARGLSKHFPVRGGFLLRAQAWVRAVDDVSFTVEPQETLGVVGESGCGKSTLARLILRLLEPDAGSVTFLGEDLRSASRRRLKRLRRDMQLVFQDPHASLNPRMTIDDAVAFSLLVHGTPRREARARAGRLSSASTRSRSTAALSARALRWRAPAGEHRARARARSQLLVLDEPVSALDKSVQAQVLTSPGSEGRAEAHVRLHLHDLT